MRSVKRQPLPISEMPFVGVVWDDAAGSSAEEYTPEQIAEAHQLRPFVTFGFLAADNDLGITLFAEQALDQKGLRGASTIPRGMVKEVVRGHDLAKWLQLTQARRKSAAGTADSHVG